MALTLPEARREKFNALFDQFLGSKTGTTRQNYADSSMLPAVQSFRPMAKGTSGGTRSTKKSPEVPQDVLDLMKANQGQKKDDGILDTLWGALTSPKKALKLGSEGLMRGIDLISRPGYAVRSGLQEVTRSLNEGEPIWSLGDDLLWGAGQGAAGFRKTGYGDIIHEAKDWNPEGKNWTNQLATGIMPNYLFARVDKQLGKINPDLEKWADRYYGLVGDIGSDPLTYVGGGTTKIIKESLGLGAAKLAGKEAFDEAVRLAGKEALQEANSPLLNIVKQTRQGGKYAAKQTVDLSDDIVRVGTQKGEDMIFDVAGGAQRGKTIGSMKETARTFAHSIAETHRTMRMEGALRNSDNFLKRLTQSRNTGGRVAAWSQSRIAQAKAGDDLFRVWHDTFTSSMGTHSFTDVNIARSKNLADRAVSEFLDAETSDIFTKISTRLGDSIMTVPTVRVLGKDVARLESLGKVLNKVGKAYDGSAVSRLTKAFSYSSNFPGYSTLIGQKTRALGNAAYEAFRNDVLRIAEGTSKADRIALQHALETGTTLTGPLEAKRLALRQMYDDILRDEVGRGVRKGVKRDSVDNYAYVHLRRENPNLKTFIENRKNAARRNGNMAGYTSREAKSLGLHPVEDAFTNILMRKVKSNRKITRQMFQQDLATHYGIKATNLSIDSARKQGLKMVDHKLDDVTKKALNLKPGEHLYLDQDIQHIYDKYTELSRIGNEDTKGLLKVIDTVTRKFKVANTIYFPGFHIRNFISDAYMGALDGVKNSDYAKIFNAFKKARNPNLVHLVDLDVGGQTIKYERLLNAYKENAAAGGFLSTDVGRAARAATPAPTGNSLVKDLGKGAIDTVRHPTSIPSNIRRFSEGREDFGRFVHFYHAMQEEYPAALRRYGTEEKAWQAAVNAATFRINKYKFDYGALTKMEQQVMRRGMPFYTYMRKAIPTLVESMFLSPRNLVYTNRVFNKLSGQDENYDGPILPDYIKQMGFLNLTGGDEPTGLAASFLPQDVFLNTLENPAANLNPLLRLPFEIANEKDTFSGKPMKNISDVLLNNWRGTALGKKIAAPDEEAAIQEKLGSVLGLPIIKVSEKKQEAQLSRNKSELNKIVNEYDLKAKAKGYHIYISNKNNIKVKNYKTGEIKTYPSLEAATAALGLD